MISPGNKIGRARGVACQMVRCIDGAVQGKEFRSTPTWPLPGAIDQPLTVMSTKFFKEKNIDIAIERDLYTRTRHLSDCSRI